MGGIRGYVIALFMLAGAVACHGTNGPSEQGAVLVKLTDAPSDDLQSATIFVSEVSLIGNGVSGSGEVISTTRAAYDLLTLQNGVTATVAAATVPTGSYSQVRLLVDSARVVLQPPKTFSDGSSTAKLMVPSGSQTGLKVTFSPPVEVTEGETVLLVDFDVSQSFVFQGPSGNPNGMLFKPVLHATAMDVAGSISGTITPALSNATVYAISGTDTVQTAFASLVTGGYTLRFLPPGNYVVAARATGFQIALSGAFTLGNAEAKIGVDLGLIASP